MGGLHAPRGKKDQEKVKQMKTVDSVTKRHLHQSWPREAQHTVLRSSGWLFFGGMLNGAISRLQLEHSGLACWEGS